MAKKRDISEDAEQEQVRLTLTQMQVTGDLIGLYGSTRGEVVSYLMRLGLERLRGTRTLLEVIAEAKALRVSRPGEAAPETRDK